MNHRRRHFIALLGIAAAVPALVGIAGAQSNSPRRVRVTHNQPFPPFSEVKNGKSEGLAVDLLRAAAEKAGIDIEFIPVPIDQMDETVKDGRSDALLIAPTPERLKAFDFTEPVVTTGGALYVRAPSATPESLNALSGKIVVTPAAGPLAALIRANAPAVNLVVTKDYEESLARVASGAADAAALNFHVGAIIASRLYPGQITLPRIMFFQSPLSIAVPKGTRPELLASFNVGLDAIRSNGTWKQINDRWSAP